MLAPVRRVRTEEIGPAEDGRGYKAVENKRSGEVAAQIIAVLCVSAAEFEMRGYGFLLTSVSAG